MPRHRDIPLARDASARFLPWLVGFMVYLAALAVAGAFAMHKVAEGWNRDLTEELTVQVMPPEELGSEPLQARIDAVTDVLRQLEGVTRVEAMTSDEVRHLVEPWLGSGSELEELPLPQLIAVRFDDRETIDVEALQARLQEIAPGTLVDDHQQWLSRLLKFTGAIQALALLIVVVVITAAVLAVVFVTRTGLSIHRNVIEILHMMGARDLYIAQQFERHSMKLGLLGGLIGIVLAAPTLWLAGRALGTHEIALLPSIAFDPWDWAVIALMPVVAAAVAMVTARITVLRTLAAIP
jgi:cell division transport system permease protein